MNTLKKLLPLCLVLCLLVGCAPEAPAAEAPTADESFTFLTSGVAPGTIVATVNGEFDVTVEEYLFWMSLYLDTYRSQGYPIMWTAEDNFEAEFKDMILEVASMHGFLSWHANSLGLVLTEEDEAQVQLEINALKDRMGEDFGFWLSSMYRNEADFAETERTMYASDMLYDYYFGEGGKHVPSEAEFADYALRGQEIGLYNAKHILIRTVDDMRQQLSEEECQVAYERVCEIYDRLVEMGPSEADFDKEMFEFSEDGGLVEYPGGYEFGPGEMVPEFEYGTLVLEPGEMSEIIESTFGYHIIFRLPVDKNSTRLREEVLGTLWNNWFDETQQSLDVQTDEVWESLDISAIDELRSAQNDAYYEAKEAAAE